MPKTPPLLLPTGSSFQEKEEDEPMSQSFLPSLAPSDYLPPIAHYLDPVVEEESENSMIDGTTNMETYLDKNESSFTGPSSVLPTTSAAVEASNNKQSDIEMTEHGVHEAFTRQTYSQPSSLTFENARAPKANNDISQNLQLSYDSVMTKYQNFKKLIDSLSATLAQSEIDQQSAIQDLQSYKDNLQARGDKLRERWTQIQIHAQDILQAPTFSEHSS